jgi:exodeoxyribonuclease-3
MRLKIATWNVNSVRAHLSSVKKFVKLRQPDILCLQETKVVDGDFPLKDFKRLGYKHWALFGQKGYHGVAIFSRDLPLDAHVRRQWCGIEDCRHLYATLPGGVELHNFYVPAGGDVPDPAANPKFAHKLAFMDEATAWFAERRAKENRFILLGDLNVAPLETDVWSHKQLLKVVSHTPVEVARMARWYESHDWVDAVRRFVPPEQKLYSWWSYRAPDWAAADKGRRLDHVWVTPALADQLGSVEVFREARGWPEPSDHVPVTVEIEI